MSVIINIIMTYGEFDQPHSVKLMKAPDMYTKASARGLARRIEFEHKDDDDIDAVLRELKKFNFTEVYCVELQVNATR